ncbi:MAG TPA: ABC transporter substrate-binding protein [Acetobacteraceae bacterium]|jgi:peptide/nickel transport system substrate-binding protein
MRHLRAVALVIGSLGVGMALPAVASELVIARAASPSGMDPAFLREPATLVDNVFDTLVGRDAKLKLVPDLALSWTALDPQTWEFKLRPDVTFTNGENFDATAVKFSIERVLDPAAHAPTISYITTLAGVDVVDGTTVRIRTKAPDPLLPTRMSRYPTYIVPPGYVKSVGNEEFARKPIGTGAYRVTEFIPDDHVTMQANAAYWRGKPSIDTVIWRALPEPTARVAALLAGEVQLVESLPVDLTPNVAADPKLDVVKVPHGGLIIYLGLKTAEKPLDDVRVRHALSMAIDRKTIITKILKGYADATGTQVGPFDFGYKDEPIPPYDPKQAKALLAEAGYPTGFAIRMQMPRHYINSAEIGQVIAQEFAAIGVTAQLEVPEWSVYAQQVPAGKQAPIYNLGWGSTQTLDADAALYPIFRTGEPYSTVSFPAMDALLDESRHTIDPTARAEILGKVQDMAIELVPALTLYQEDSLYARRKTVTFAGRADARIPLFDMTVAD